ncbi:zf-CCHC domain-containing protein, partial [Tanacetum coccineum]
TSLKALDESFSSKNYVRKFLRALHPKWRAKGTAIEESKDLSSLSLDELIGNLKVHEMITKKDSQLVGKKIEKIKSLVSKAKKESSDDETSTSESEDEEYAMAVRNFRRLIRRRGRFIRQSRDEKKSLQRNWENKNKKDEWFIRECLKLPKCKNQKAYVGGALSDNSDENKRKDNGQNLSYDEHIK